MANIFIYNLITKKRYVLSLSVWWIIAAVTAGCSYRWYHTEYSDNANITFLSYQERELGLRRLKLYILHKNQRNSCSSWSTQIRKSTAVVAAPAFIFIDRFFSWKSAYTSNYCCKTGVLVFCVPGQTVSLTRVPTTRVNMNNQYETLDAPWFTRTFNFISLEIIPYVYL